MFVVEDQEKNGNKFDEQLKAYCEKALGARRSNTNSGKRKKDASNPPENRKRCLGARDFQRMKEAIAARKNNKTNDNVDSDNEEKEDEGNEEFESGTITSTNAVDHLATLD